MAKDQPTHFGYVVTDKNKKSFWTKIGAVFPHEDGEGWDLIIPDGISVSGRVTIRKPLPKTDAAPNDARDDGHEIAA